MRRPPWFRLAFLAASVFGVLALGVIIYVATDKGRIKIVVDGPQPIITIDGETVRIEGLDESITLRAGEHILTVKRGGTEVETRKFIVRRGNNEDLRVEYEPIASDRTVANRQTSPSPETASRDTAGSPAVGAPDRPSITAAPDLLQPGSVWVTEPGGWKFTVLERQGERFKSLFVVAREVREVNGTIKDGQLRWLARDVNAIAGRPGGDNEGQIKGNEIAMTWSDPGGPTLGYFTLRLKKPAPASPAEEKVSVSRTADKPEGTKSEPAQAQSAVKKPPSPPIAVAVREPVAGFRPLFNGKDLSGWHVEGGHAETWEVEPGGVIVARGQDWKTRNYLLTDREYTDFALRLEFNLDKGSGSGLAIRALPGDQMPMPNGNRIFDHPLFKLIGPLGREETGTTHWILAGMHVRPDRPAELMPAGSWNRLEVEVANQTMRPSINGRPVLDARLDPGAVFPDGTIPGLDRAKGHIGLQKHTGTARFRNIEIKEPDNPASGGAGAHGPERAQKRFRKPLSRPRGR